MRRARMCEPLSLLTDRFDTPIGTMVIVADQEGNLRAVDWADEPEGENTDAGLARRPIEVTQELEKTTG
jgi:hypothetical protein